MAKRRKYTYTERARKGGYARAKKLGARKLRDAAIRMNAIRWDRERAARAVANPMVVG